MCNLLSNSEIMLFPQSIREKTNVNNAIELEIIVKIGVVIILSVNNKINNGIILITNIIS